MLSVPAAACALLVALPAAPRDEAFPPDLPVATPRATAEARIPASIEATAIAPDLWRVRFAHRPEAPVGAVALAGSFNGWSVAATPMTRGDDGAFVATLELGPGTHLYKFVLDGDRWRDDPENPERADDGHGGNNSMLRLGALANLRPGAARRGDGVVDAIGLRHDPASPRDLQLLADGRLLLRLAALADDADGAEVVLETGAVVAMHRAVRDGLLDVWEAALAAPAPGTRYAFVLRDGDAAWRAPEIHRFEPEEMRAMRTPEWAKDATWYQVMVDRFRNGTPVNDPPYARPWTSDWYAPSAWERESGQSFYAWYVFRRLYGGDLQGLGEKLDYLVDLGINALYLNPVFQSPSHHKYDGSSYLHVDEHYGMPGGYATAVAREDLLDPATWTWTASDRIFLDFLRAAKERGFRVVIDGVFNHVGTAHPAFRDVERHGPKSRYADWFQVRSWSPFAYDGWAGFGELPAFAKRGDDLASASLKAHLLAATRRWMDPDGDGDPSDGIDGWRLDVPNEIGQGFWEEWCAEVRAINPEAYIVGEIWDRAESWLDGRTFDAVMNYEWARIAIAWIGDRARKITASEADRRFAALRLAYPEEATLALQNLLGSHDTDRVVSMLQNPDRDYDRQNREQDDPGYDASRPAPEAYRRARLLALLQAVSPGAPMIYYGDEAGMWGSDDPNNRKPMLWAEDGPHAGAGAAAVMEDHLDHHRAVLRLRRDHVALRRGTLRTLVADDAQDVWVFLRETPEESVLVALNASDRPATIALPESVGAGWRPVFGENGERGWPRITIPPVAGRCWSRSLR